MIIDLHLKSDNDNRLDPDVVEDRKLERRERGIEAMAKDLRGRTDLLFVALDTRKLMLDTQAQMIQLNARKKASALDAERALLGREILGLIAKHKAASDRFQAIEIAMDEETRYKFWQQMDAYGVRAN